MIDYQEDWLASVILKWRGSVAPRALWYALPAACVAPLLLLLEDLWPGVYEGIGLEAVASSVLWSSTTACVMFLVGFRSKQALGRFWEGTGLLHQMRGEWFDACSCLMAFSRSARASKPKEVAEFRHALVRLVSLLHGSALEEIKAQNNDVYEVIDIRGLDPQTRSYLRECKDDHGFNRVEVLLHMVQVLMTQNLQDGVLAIPPPILSRVYQTLSRGFVILLNARKITDTKFPFPFVQLISGLLIFHSLLTPVVIAAIIQHKAWAALFTFIPVFGLFSLNFIAIELEAPFGDDENDLPLKRFQKEMNNGLLMLLSDEADHIVHTSKTAIKHVRGLQRSLAKSLTANLDQKCDEKLFTRSLSNCLERLPSPADNDTKETSILRTSRIGWASEGSGKPDRPKSIFDTDDVSIEEVREAKAKSVDEVCVELISTPRKPPSVSKEHELDDAQEIKGEQEISCDFVVRSRSLMQRQAAGMAASSTDVGTAVEQLHSTSRPALSSHRWDVDCEAAGAAPEHLAERGRILWNATEGSRSDMRSSDRTRRPRSSCMLPCSSSRASPTCRAEAPPELLS